MKIIIIITLLITVIFITDVTVLVNGYGSSSTLAISYGSQTVCGIVAAESRQGVQCFGRNGSVLLQPNISYEGISGGRDFFCGLSSGGLSFFCWDSVFTFKRVYYNSTVRLRDLSVGEDHVCAIYVDTGFVDCWRGQNGNFPSPVIREKFVSLTSGRGFSCGILSGSQRIHCWGVRNDTAFGIQNSFGNISMLSLNAGDSHVCGFSTNGSLICNGNNESGQLDFPSSSNSTLVLGSSSLALGLNHSCAIGKVNGSVVCWGGNGGVTGNATQGISFESVVAGSNFTCGLTTANLSVICWGAGFSMNTTTNSSNVLPLPKIIPGPCTQSLCSCGVYPDSDTLCSGSGNICRQCENNIITPSTPSPLSPSPSPPPREGSKPSFWTARNKGLLAFAIVGSVGTLFGICTVIYCLWTGICCCRQKKIHNSVQPTITRGNSNPTQSGSGPLTPPFSRSSTIRRQSSRAMRRQRSGTSSIRGDRAQEFSLSDLALATNQFALENKIGGGSFGLVYKGKLSDGRKVAIKRGENSSKLKKLQENESAFQSELEFLSRLHHKHLVGLVGFCEEKDERLLVYEYMKNGALYDHLHSTSNVEKSSSILNSWKMRIKVVLDAARGLEYLHVYAVPPIIHRDIKSSNILLDATWTGKVSDFGLSLMGPEVEGESMSMKAAGTVGYMDPEYYGLNILTPKTDIYCLGVVLLEVLTGKRAILKDEEDGGNLIRMVEFVVPKIMSGELWDLLDVRVGKPEGNEAEAVELVAYTALRCVSVEGKDRPTISDIVANLDRALLLCEEMEFDEITIVSE
ncbi:hypothetical protein MKW94_007261 [Papaver nudicaule]|uniref:Protein kinase domain-containing protein n=1 Tax=Papaver nudicaule TaxID=74823 RepID=A0AA42B1W4_PAPNU|nr:hypothetical protein [Papaver nudicaule]MCL7048345.1 hypothetical protein [Papaver nudicaule]